MYVYVGKWIFIFPNKVCPLFQIERTKVHGVSFP